MLQLNLVAYDPTTERLQSETRIPDEAAIKALQLAGINFDDVATGPIGEIPLEPEQAIAVARLLAMTAKPSRFDYFLETTTTESPRSG